MSEIESKSKIDISSLTVKQLYELSLEDKDLIKDRKILEFLKQATTQVAKKEKNRENYKPDEALKYSLSQVEKPKLIALINKICGTNFDVNSKVTELKTEHIKTTGTPSKGKVIGDYAVKIESKLNGEVTDTVIVEFQSDEDIDIPFRVYVYGFNHSKMVQIEVKDVVNDTQVTMLKDVKVSPIEVIIYTTHGVKEKFGEKEFHHSSKKFKVNGVEHSVDNGDVMTDVIPYVNLLRMDISELNTPEFDFLQPVYLYQYKKYPRLIKSKNKNFQEDLETIQENIDKLKGGAKRAAKEMFVGLILDLTQILSKNKKIYKKELSSMDYLAGTYAGQLLEEGRVEGREEARAEARAEKLEFIINMLSDFTDKQISKVCKLSLEEVAEIREANMN